MATNSIARLNNRLMPLVLAIITFGCFVLSDNDVVRYISAVMLLLCAIIMAIIFFNKRKRIITKMMSTILPWFMLEMAICVWAAWMNRQNEWFASWKWALVIFVLSLSMLFTGDFRQICKKNGKIVAYNALVWLFIWMLMHFLKLGGSMPPVFAIFWYLFTLITSVSIIYGHFFKHISNLFLPSVLFLCFMDICCYQIYPYVEFGIPLFRSILWLG